MNVTFHPEAEIELNDLPVDERVAMLHAVEKLSSLGIHLPFPHASHVQGAASLRELRPRGGRSRWRAFYRRIGDALVIASIGPEAKVDRQGFQRSVVAAQERLDAIQAEGNTG